MIREALAVFFGSELIIGSLFGAWFLSIAVGARLGSGLAGRTARPVFWFLTAVAAGLAVLPLQLIGLRLSRLILGIPVGGYAPFVSALFTVLVSLAPFGLMIGFTFPIGCRLAMVIGRERESIGLVYVIEAVGAVLGGLIFTFFLLGRLSAFGLTALLLGLSLVLLPLLVRPKIGLLLRTVHLLAVLAVTAGLFSIYHRLDTWSLEGRWRSQAGELELVRSVDSRYQHLSLFRQDDQYGIYGNGLFFFTVNDPYGYSALANYVLAQHPRPDSVLIVGGGAGLPAAMLESDLERIDTVRLDPAVGGLVNPILSPGDRRVLDDPRYRVHYGDGRSYVRTTDRRYDIVFLDLPDPASAMINRYYTAEFFRMVQEALTAGGVLGLRLTAAENYLSDETADYAASVFHTLRSVFGHVLVTSGDTYLMFASEAAGSITDDTDLLTGRYRRSGVVSPYFSPYLFEIIMPPERLRFVRHALESKEDVPLNRDLRPITYLFNLLLRDRSVGGPDSRGTITGIILNRLMAVHADWLFALLITLVAWRLGYLVAVRPERDRRERFNGMAAVGVCGFTAMGLEVILLYGYQNLFGSLYHMVALMTAAFMFGLAIGSYMITRLLGRIERPVRAFILLQSLTALFALVLPTLLTAVASALAAGIGEAAATLLYLIPLIVPGVLTGAGFPLAGRIYLESGQGVGVGRTAGMVDFADHLGAFGGAMLTGTILVPIFGVPTATSLIGALNIACIILWLQLRGALVDQGAKK
jgi:spermidine synthase